jgi:hypothetical protein
MLPRAEHELEDGPPEIAVRGPWTDLRQALARDRLNREALHRMMAARRTADARAFADWVAGHRGLPPGSPLLLLPLYAMAESHAQASRLDPLADRRWSRETGPTDLAWSWFRHTVERAAEVFRAMGAFASQRPWSLIYGPDQAVAQFVRARTHCLSVGPLAVASPPRFYTPSS